MGIPTSPTRNDLGGLDEKTRVIDFGCAKAKALILWARYLCISGSGSASTWNTCALSMAGLCT